ncbi:MAG TPA: hypothetical protein VEC12_14090 [Bacteroidia bacterium]|nr:hypothetical protein [Bacteroidia bacterium]
MKVFIKSAPEHAVQSTTPGAQNSSVAAAHTDACFFDATAEQLGISFDEHDFGLAPQEIEKMKATVLGSFTEFIAPGEQLVDHRLGMALKTNSGLYEGSPVLIAKTNTAQYTVVYDELVLPKSNAHPQAAEPDNYQLLAGMPGNPAVLFFARQFATALAKGLVSELFSIFFPKDKDAVLKEELKKLKEEIRQMLQEMKYENLEDELLTTRAWLRDTYSEKLEAYAKKQTFNIEEVRKDLKARQERMHGVAEVISQRTANGDLANCDYFARVKVMLYATCAALRIVLMKEQIFWQNVMRAQGNKDYENDADLQELTKYVKAVSDNLKNYVQMLKKGRLDKIGTLQQNRDFIHGITPIVVEIFWWHDDFEAHNPNDPFKTNKIVFKRAAPITWMTPISKVEEVKAETQQALNNHIANVTNVVKTHIEEPLQEIINNLDNTRLVIQ